MTLAVMREFGVEVERRGQGYHVEPQRYVPCDYRVPSDFSSAAFPLVAGALGGEASVEGLDMDDPQGDRRIAEILRLCGCDVRAEGGALSCRRTGRPKAVDVDMSDIPDLFPIVAVLLSTADSEKGRQQKQLMNSIGSNILEIGYCVHPDKVDPAYHPEQGPIWEWYIENIEEIAPKLGANYHGDGPGALRKIREENLEEVRRIFEVTGGMELRKKVLEVEP